MAKIMLPNATIVRFHITIRLIIDIVDWLNFCSSIRLSLARLRVMTADSPDKGTTDGVVPGAPASVQRLISPGA
jgi:hypothetical protein|tara:strand:+ start:250 stop:471 length:222 start_codon:yes stop_codon:yes gene_type:complete